MGLFRSQSLVRRLIPISCLLICGITAQGLLADPGFGTLKKKKLTLSVRQPAAVRLSGGSFAVTLPAGNNRAYQAVQESLIPSLETELISNEKSLVKRPPAEADYVIQLRITNFSIAQPEQRYVGNQVSTHWTGTLRLAYQVTRGGRVLDASNVNVNYDKEFDGSSNARGVNLGAVKIPLPGHKNSAAVPHTIDDVKQILVDDVVSQVAAKLGNTSQKIDVLVAGGDDHLNRSAEFMFRNLWSRAIDELERMDPFSKPEEDAYRQYNLGLAHEGMAYEATNLNDQKSNLLQAQEYYDKSLEMNLKEKYFVEAVARTKQALARYKTFEGMQKGDAKAAPKSAPKGPPAQTAPVQSKKGQ
jgi:hypothetical protein